jgi:hypothetical protein
MMVIDKPRVKNIDIVKLSNKLGNAIEIDPFVHNDKECIWPLEGAHSGDVMEVRIFERVLKKGLKIYICEYHLTHHMAIMALGSGKSEDEVEFALSLSHDECVCEALKLCVPIVEL